MRLSHDHDPTRGSLSTQFQLQLISLGLLLKLTDTAMFYNIQTYLLLILLVPHGFGNNEVSPKNICVLPDNFQGSCDDDTHAREGFVFMGTQCSYLSEQNAVPIVCDRNGEWTEGSGITSTENHHIQKRSLGAIIFGIAFVIGVIASIVCRYTCENKAAPPQNQTPNIVCPKVSDHIAPDGETTATVSWPNPTVTDAEDGGSINPTRDGPSSGSEFDEGTNIIVYKATDSGGLSVVCTITFKVKVNRCYQMPWPNNGNISCDKREISGSNCELHCNKGYEPGGAHQAVCSKNTWNATFSCIAKECETVPDVDNGNVSCTGKTYKSFCSVMCNEGYTVDSPSMIICEANGNFTLPGKCKDVQDPVFPNGCPVDVVDYAEKKGRPTITSWIEPSAEDNSKEPPTLRANAAMTDPFPIGRTVVTYVATDAAGNTAQCSFVVNIMSLVCDEPDFDKSGKNLLTHDCPDGMMYGHSCNMSCKSGYPLEGSASIQCDKKPGNISQPQVHWTILPGFLRPYCKINPCNNLQVPKNGSLSCDTWAHGKMCQMQCNDQWDVPRNVPDQYVCGESDGRWRPYSRVEDCTERRVPDKMMMPSELYYFSGDCPNPATQQQIKENFIAMLRGNTQYKEACSESVPECRAEFVNVKCGTTSRRRKRDAEIEVVIDFNIIISYYEDGQNIPQLLQEYEQRFNNISNAIKGEIMSGNLDIGISGLVLQDDPFASGRPDFICAYGTRAAHYRASCAGCPSGTYYNKTVDDCSDCPKGKYQDEGFSESCKDCPDGYSTLTAAGRNLDSCIAMCAVGTFSSTGLKPCSPCPDGSYQTSRGKTSCVPCPYWQTTGLQGSHDKSDCTGYDIFSDEDLTLAQCQTDLTSLSVVFWIHFFNSSTSSEVGFLNHTHRWVSVKFSDSIGVTVGSETVYSQVSVIARQWLHVALVLNFNTSNVALFANGHSVVSKVVSGLSSPVVPAGAQFQLHLASAVTVSGVAVISRILSDHERKLLSSKCGISSITDIAIVLNDQLIGIQTPSKCDAVNECESGPCGEHTCINEIGGYTCRCLKGYKGRHCEIPPDHCLHHMCENRAQCLNNYSDYSCVCVEGFRGTLCEETIAHGGWGNWTDWGECSATCGGGIKMRNRECNSPPPDHDGKPCSGNSMDTKQCQSQKCPSCPSLPRAYGVVRKCNESKDIIRCTIACRDDLMFVEEILPLYFCGRETNYTWNHQTRDNPQAKFPICSRAKSPNAYKMKHTVDYPSLPCDPNKNNQMSINQQITKNTDELELPCIKNLTCHSKTEFHTCDGTGRKKRAAASSATIFLVSSWNDALLLNIATAVKNGETLPKEIMNFIIKMANFELSAQQLVNSTTSIFTVTLDGKEYVGDIGSARTSVDVVCPPGTTPVTGLCGECPPGSKEVDSLCVLCGRGSYQEWAGRKECDICPAGKTTLGLGSTSEDECISDGKNQGGSPSGDTDDKTMVIVLTTTICSLMFVVAVVAAAIFWKHSRARARVSGSSGQREETRGSTPPPPSPPYMFQKWHEKASVPPTSSTMPPLRAVPLSSDVRSIERA